MAEIKRRRKGTPTERTPARSKGCCSLTTVLLLTAVCVLGLAYLTYTPFPAQASNHGTKRYFGLFYRTSVLLGQIGSFLGLGDAVKITRGILARGDHLGGSDQVTVTESTMDGVRVLIIRPKSATEELLPGLVYFHGGGWIYQSPDVYLPPCRYLSEVTNSVVVSVDYRLAPEHLFPAAIEDAITVTRYFLGHANEFGVNPLKIGVSGDSAGGNLAMATALNLSKADDTRLPPLKLQFVIYPAIQMIDLNLPAYVTHGDGPGFLRKAPMIDFYLMYLFGETTLYDVVAANMHTSPALKKSKYASYVSTELLPEQFRSEVTSEKSNDFRDEAVWKRIEEKVLDPLFSPLMASDEDLSNMPPAYVLIAEFDVLRDDGFLTVARFKQANVPVEFDYLPSEEHGIYNMPDQEENREANRKFLTFFKKYMT